jgi:hypothetical protein
MYVTCMPPVERMAQALRLAQSVLETPEARLGTANGEFTGEVEAAPFPS